MAADVLTREVAAAAVKTEITSVVTGFSRYERLLLLPLSWRR
jgi:hypothetical protein